MISRQQWAFFSIAFIAWVSAGISVQYASCTTLTC
jgi:hypothetical protein